jgi:flagellar L-ring protein precursor FlgH
MRILAIAFMTLCATLTAAQKPKKEPPESALDQTLKQVAAAQGTERQAVQPGSVWTPTSLFSDLTSDLRARRVGDIVTILVQENLSAVSSGTSKTQRNSTLQASITAAGGITRATGPLTNLANAATTRTLDGQGATTRATTLTATISAVVTQVLPNGSLVIQGTKNVKINSENQILGLRGLVRPVDLDTTNTVSSDRVAQMDLQVNGKGIVGDQVKQPFILYRLLMDILP